MKKNKPGTLLYQFCFVFSFLSFQAIAQKDIGIFEGQTGVGNPSRPGSASYNTQTAVYTIVGAGTNMWADRDEFHYVWKKLKGNFILRTQANFIGKGIDPHRKLGWMVRSSLDADATHVNAVVHGDGLTSLQYRPTRSGQTEEIKSAITGADVIQLERKGNRYILSVARYGDVFTRTELDSLSIGDEVYVGLFVCSHNKDVSEKASFSNVRIVIPVPDDFVTYRNYIGSNLEVMDIKTGNSKIIYYSPNSLQAPNWTIDGRALIYNSKGLIYRFDLAKKIPVVIPTDFANNNNNDHVLSFDGKTLGLSHNNKEDSNQSVVYTVPVSGGKPKRVTEKSPSYLHGWSPDGKYLLYTGARNGEFDIYKIPVKGGQEIRLTDAKGLDDGSEYSPDGKYIWFNSNRTGTMEIWRMKPDGSNQEQMTNGELNNWFPHVSPDGKWVVYLSFSKEIPSGDHPFYKQVYLQIMPATGGKSKVIAYLYGGQATINTPSWSPDSKKIAFISNSDNK